MDPSHIHKALAGDRRAQRRLYEHLLPIVHGAVARRLYWLARPHGRDARVDLDDFVQDVMRRLWEDRGRALRGFEPARGSLKVYVATIADRHVLNAFRSKSRDPFGEPSMSHDAIDDRPEVGQSLEGQVLALDQLDKLRALLSEHLDEFGMLMFQLFIEGRSTEDICAQTGLARDAVYQRRRRLNKLLGRLIERLHTGGPAPSASDSAGSPQTELGLNG